MSLFSTAAQASLARPQLLGAFGLALYFNAGTQRYIRSGDNRVDPLGRTWLRAPAVAMSGFTFGIGRRRQAASITLSAIDATTLQLAKNQTAEIRGQNAELFMHLFNSDWSYVEAPTSLGVYAMDRLTVRFDAEKMTGDVTLNLEPLTATRFRAPGGYLDQADQQIRYPAAGDNGLAYTGKYVVSGTIANW